MSEQTKFEVSHEGTVLIIRETTKPCMTIEEYSLDRAAGNHWVRFDGGILERDEIARLIPFLQSYVDSGKFKQ